MLDGARILIVEDEPAIADTLVYALRTEGFVPEWRSTARAGLVALAEGTFALVVLDVGLPDGSGFEVCKQIRARSAVPVLFLTARNTELDRVLGLELGADDYLAKPFSPRELTARVKAILRRTQLASSLAAPGTDAATSVSGTSVGGTSVGVTNADAAARRAELAVKPGAAAARISGAPFFGGVDSGGPAGPAGAREGVPLFAVDEERCAIAFCGAELVLTRYEFRLLKTLVAKPGRVFSREQLMTAVWEDPGASLDRTVDAHIKMLRAKLRAIAPERDPIQTHRGLGYSLRASR